MTLCATPAALEGTNLFDVKQNLCKIEEKKSGSFFSFLVLIGVGCGILAIYRYYRRRRRVEVPFEFGYTGLETDDDVQPEFV